MNQRVTAEPETREPSLAISLIPAVCLIALLFVSIAVLRSSGHIPLIAATAVAALVASIGLGQTWAELEHGMVESIRHALPAVLILMAVGLLIGVWIASGVVPLLIYYGLEVMAPRYFLAASCVVCSIISLSTGSSWSTAATAGLALVGVGQVLGIPAGMTAGAVVSGAYFGDKLSPLSDTTNLASATAGTDLFTHIRHMLYTTVPSLAIALVIYLILGFEQATRVADTSAAYLEMTGTLARTFDLTPWLLVAPLTVLFLIVRKTPPLPALIAGAFVGAILLLLFQPQNAPQGVGSVIAILYGGFSSDTGIAAVDNLLSRGGLSSMMDTIALILCAFSFGGVMEASGMLGRLTKAVLSLAKSSGSLIAATVASCIGMNVLAADQYLAIVLPGRMYRIAFAERNLAPQNLSRALEDAGTMTSPLVPWNTCGAYMASVLGVATLTYLPFAFINLLGPVISIIYGFTGFTIVKADRG